MTMQVQNDIKAGLGALALLQSKKPEGLGAIGPYGNVDGSTVIQQADYQITGTQVAMRNPLTPGLPNDSSVVMRLNTGDTVAADGATFQGVNDANGQFVNFAFVALKSDPTKQGYVAVEYLAPAGSVQPAPGGGGGGAQPVSMTTTTAVAGATDYTPWILGGVAVLGLGVIGWAAMSKKKKGRHARA